MVRRIKIEILVFLAILLVLAVVQHPDLLSSPLERFALMQEHQNYTHPFLWSGGVYVVVGFFRVVVAFLLKLRKR